MNFNAAALQLMLDKGLSLSDVVEIASANERRADPTATERKRRQRTKEKAESDMMSQRDVTRDTPPDGSPKENNQTPSLPPATPNVISSEITPPAEIELKPEHVIEAWNDLAARHGLAMVKKMTPERRRKLNTFIVRHSIDDITEAIAAIPRSPFLLGENGRGWRASFDWFLEPRNLTKLTEQTYVH